MSSQTEEQTGSPVDTALMLLALGLVGGSIYGFYFFEGEFNTLVRVIGVVLSVVLALILVYQTATGRTAWSYVHGSRLEMRKMVWPTKQEAVQTTLLIAVVVLILALMLWGLDAVLLWGVKALTGRT